MSGTMLFTGLRFNLSPGIGGADASRPVDGGPGSACNGNPQENGSASCLLQRNQIPIGYSPSIENTHAG